MEKISIESTYDTPYIEFDPDGGNLIIEGRLIPEDPGILFDPLLRWLNNYFKDPQKKTVLNVRLEYLNSSSSKYITGILLIMAKHFTAGNDIEVNWYYEDDDETILEMGEHYKEMLEVPIKLIPFIDE